MSNFYAHLGSTTYINGGQFFSVTSFTVHPNYKWDTLDYDFGIVALEREIPLGDTMAIIPLTSGSNPSDDSMVTVSGWGVTTVR